jgi:hypothetical protein
VRVKLVRVKLVRVKLVRVKLVRVKLVRVKLVRVKYSGVTERESARFKISAGLNGRVKNQGSRKKMGWVNNRGGRVFKCCGSSNHVRNSCEL